jgi:putative membrane protein
MKLNIVQSTIVLAGTGLMLGAAALFAADGPISFHRPSASMPVMSSLKISDSGEFLEAANMINLTEIEMGRLVYERGQSKSIRKLGERMVHDHSIMENQLKALAAARDIVLSTGLDVQHQQRVDELASCSRAAFDRHYAEDKVKFLPKEISLFEQEAGENEGRSVRDFAANTLPVLEELLQWADRDSQVFNPPVALVRGQPF